jgi:hypothetical protein
MKYSFKNAEFVLRKVKDYLNQDIANNNLLILRGVEKFIFNLRRC